VAAVWYIVRLLVKAGRDPTRLGAWLPRVLAGWYIGLTEWEEARLEHEEAKQKRTKQKLAAVETPKELPAAVTVQDAGEQHEDKVVASQSDPPGPIEPTTAAEVTGESAHTLPHHSGASRRSRARHRERTSAPS
jgi:hypothetical protein